MKPKSPSIHAGVVACSLAALAFAGCLQKLARAPTMDELPNTGLKTLLGAKELTFAFETVPACKLERLQVERYDAREGWVELEANAAAGQSFEVIDARLQTADEKAPAQFLALLLRDSKGASQWVRNAPAGDADESALRWRCAVDVRAAEGTRPKVDTKTVQLVSKAGSCSWLTPIAGDAQDVFVGPYQVKAVSLYAGRPPSARKAAEGSHGVMAFGVGLAADDERRQLIIPFEDFQRCFESVQGEQPAISAELTRWLDEEPASVASAPDVPFEPVRSAAGLTTTACTREGKGATEHFECIPSVLRVAALPGPGEFGPPALQLIRTRVREAIHGYGGKLIPASEAIGWTVAIAPPKTHGRASLAKAIEQELAASVETPEFRLQRANLGFRLVRSADVPSEASASVTVTIDVTAAVPAVETLTETRTLQRRGEKKETVSPAFPGARRTVENLRGQVAAVHGPYSPIAREQRSAREAELRRRLSEAEQRLQPLAQPLQSEPQESYSWTGKVVRRKAEATVRVTMHAGEISSKTDFAITDKFPFEAAALPSDSKDPKPPTAEDAEKALARELAVRIDDYVARWIASRRLSEPSSLMEFGSRPWAAALASRVVAERPVRLVADLLENREESLRAPMAVYPVTIGAGDANRCIVVSAAPTDGRSDLNLVFGLPPASGSKRFLAMARDARLQPDAAIELCGVAPGQYAIGVWSPGSARPRSILVSLFESTPGGVSAEQGREASRGEPRVPQNGEKTALEMGVAP